MAAQLVRGIPLRRQHRDPFRIGRSVRGSVAEADGKTWLDAVFELDRRFPEVDQVLEDGCEIELSIGGDYDPEIARSSAEGIDVDDMRLDHVATVPPTEGGVDGTSVLAVLQRYGERYGGPMKNLKARREALGMSIADLAERAGLEPAELEAYETGSAEADDETMARIHGFLSERERGSEQEEDDNAPDIDIGLDFDDDDDDDMTEERGVSKLAAHAKSMKAAKAAKARGAQKAMFANLKGSGKYDANRIPEGKREEGFALRSRMERMAAENRALKRSVKVLARAERDRALGELREHVARIGPTPEREEMVRLVGDLWESNRERAEHIAAVIRSAKSGVAVEYRGAKTPKEPIETRRERARQLCYTIRNKVDAEIHGELQTSVRWKGRDGVEHFEHF